MPDGAIIAANVKELMRQQRITRKELSRRLMRIFDRRFSVSSIDRLLSGHHKITDHQLVKLGAIADVLNVSFEALIRAPARNYRTHRG